jgi:hypothetical protein
MTLSDIIDVEEALTKTGPELFKELYRIYPVAEPDDYFKNGQWRNDVMKTDIVLIESHRRESGAPDVPDLDDLKLPKLPEASLTGSAPNALGALSLQQKLMPNILPTTPNGAPAITATSTPVVEIRLIALFVSKWKLDAVKAKTELAKLSQAGGAMSSRTSKQRVRPVQRLRRSWRLTLQSARLMALGTKQQAQHCQTDLELVLCQTELNQQQAFQSSTSFQRDLRQPEFNQQELSQSLT